MLTCITLEYHYTIILLSFVHDNLKLLVKFVITFKGFFVIIIILCDRQRPGSGRTFQPRGSKIVWPPCKKCTLRAMVKVRCFPKRRLFNKELIRDQLHSLGQVPAGAGLLGPVGLGHAEGVAQGRYAGLKVKLG